MRKAARLLPAPFRQRAKLLLGDGVWGRKSFSQEGEDLLLDRILPDKPDGRYVDIGAHHPYKWSNTYLFYAKGWRGVNVDPRPGFAEEFLRVRPRDICLECGVGSAAGSMTFYVFNEPALSTFDVELAKQRDGLGTWRLVDEVSVPVRPLSEILSENTEALGNGIDFMSVDAEGRDLDVLRSNDWSRFRPTYIVAEDIGKSVSDALKSDLGVYLQAARYELIGKLWNSVFYRRAD